MNRDYAEMTANLTLNWHFRKASTISLPLNEPPFWPSGNIDQSRSAWRGI
jgi:hypothetical protein